MADKSISSPKVFDESEIESALIDLVREQPILYDKNSSNYKNRVSRENAFKEIGAKLGLQAAECQKLWSNLRAQYMGFRRKLLKPSGSGKKSRPFFRHEEAMRFIGELCGDDNTVSNIEGEDQEGDQQDKDDNEHIAPDVEVAGAVAAAEEDIETPKNPLVPRSSKRNDYRSHEKFGGRRKLDPFDENLLALLKTEDQDEHFGKMVGTKLKIIRNADKKKAADVEFKIHSLLHEVEMEL